MNRSQPSRSYQQYCGLARALDLVGQRWTLLVVRNLLLGPARYKDLLEHLPGITTNLLAQRLKEMEALGLIERQRLVPPASGHAYALTADGWELEPVIMALGRWGQARLGPPEPADRMDARWALVSLKRRYLGGFDLRVGLTLAGEPFTMILSPEYLDVRTGHHAPTELHLAGELRPLMGLFMAMAPARELLEAGAIRYEGPRRAFRQLLRAFGVRGAST